MLTDVTKHSIHIKRSPTKRFAPSLSWWNHLYTTAVKTRFRLFKKYRSSHTYNDFLEYQESNAATTKILKNAKKKLLDQISQQFKPPPFHLFIFGL